MAEHFEAIFNAVREQGEFFIQIEGATLFPRLRPEKEARLRRTTEAGAWRYMPGFFFFLQVRTVAG